MSNANIKIYDKPVFNKITGYVLPGIYLMTIEDLLNHKILGKSPERVKLIKSLQKACEIYWEYGLTEIYANGSFATSKPVPADIDGYIKISSSQQNIISKIEKSGSIWGIFKSQDGKNGKYPMWFEHKIEFYLQIEESPMWDYFFTHSRDGIERGIIKVVKSKEIYK
jgi:hypothetical protein